MGGQSDWLERGAWSARAREFGELLDGSGGVGMTYPAVGSGVTVEPPLWALWFRAGAHPHLVAAIRPGVLRYAALDAVPPQAALDAAPDEVARWASWGLALRRLYDHLTGRVGLGELGWMAVPRVWIDLASVARVGFASALAGAAHAALLPPEILDHWPRIDERAVVFVVGQALGALARPSRTLTPGAQLVRRCVERDPARRFQSLDELYPALHALGGRLPIWQQRHGVERPAWKRLEEGLGELELGRPERAELHFRAALRLEPGSPHAAALHAEALRRIPAAPAPVVTLAPEEPAPPTAAGLEQRAAEREAARDFGDALALYERAAASGGDPLACALGAARAALAHGETRSAARHAGAALARAPEHVAAHAVRVAACLREGDRVAALAAADAWLATAPEDGAAHVARGKALLGLARWVEARAAFERACVAAPSLLEGLWLRREADRMLQGVRASVGTAAPMASPIPEHLAALREAMATGRVAAGIALLERAEHADDAVAQLLLGELLAHDQRRVAALAAFDRAAALGPEHVPAAQLGRARVLLELGRADEVLALCDRIAAARPAWLEPRDLRAVALARLDRPAEAEAAARAYARGPNATTPGTLREPGDVASRLGRGRRD